ncbi:phosphoglycerate mutase family protein [Jeotgalibacillus sp. ET6]|uniref:histidine phosphatase family protein n=1 Tax=Jeotgalibacillus sp. ET6 TaxID=3037260 RepID=UPI002418A9E1|nr:histidine phosphatase family protein [Jeotgalibacillus sp. ET6]MDG5472438.1 phosphoglycerate mutase family protein [Jeotgalibacillus sp. ET6]
MLTTIYLVRHAHSIYSPDELNRPLSERGKEDAVRVTSLLKLEKIDTVISSPYKRAIQTVEGIAQYIEKEINIVEDFRERLLSDKPIEDFQHSILKVWEDAAFSWEGGESNVTAQQRGVQALFEVLEKHQGQRVAIGTHGNIMVLIMNYFNKQYDVKFWRELKMPDIYKLNFEGKSLLQVERVECKPCI